MENLKKVKSNLAKPINPLDFDQVFGFVHSLNALDQLAKDAKNLVRKHNSINNEH